MRALLIPFAVLTALTFSSASFAADNGSRTGLSNSEHSAMAGRSGGSDNEQLGPGYLVRDRDVTGSITTRRPAEQERYIPAYSGERDYVPAHVGPPGVDKLY